MAGVGDTSDTHPFVLKPPLHNSGPVKSVYCFYLGKVYLYIDGFSLSMRFSVDRNQPLS
jgi:hypothetical protein